MLVIMLLGIEQRSRQPFEHSEKTCLLHSMGFGFNLAMVFIVAPLTVVLFVALVNNR